MKLVTFTHHHHTRIGAVTEEAVIDFTQNQSVAPDMINFLASEASAPRNLHALVQTCREHIPLDEVHLEAPVPQPGKYLGIGLNYADHIEETQRERPEYPTVFNKQTSCVIGPEAAIHRPKVSEKLDYEGELAFIIGQRCRHVPKNQAHSVIAGYTIANDVSVRDWQMRSHTWTLGKSFDTHGPLGPWIVTCDEIGDPHALAIKTWVNDELRQSSNTKHLIFDCYALVEYLSSVMTLEPGDTITTGTSSGVGVAMKPRGYMKPGDSVTIEIEKIGRLRNPIIEEPDDLALY